jgi:hypothetical protein
VSLTEKLAAPPPEPPPAGWRPRVDIDEAGAVIVTEATPVEDSATSSNIEFAELLEEHGLTPGQWTVKSHSSSRWQSASGEWRESHRLTAIPNRSTVAEKVDLDDLQKAVRRVRRRPPELGTENVSVIGVLSDMQVGKTDSRGGTEELLQRMETSRYRFRDYIAQAKPEEIVLLDAGDPIENFENTGSQDRTNDLQLTEQIRVWRRIFWTWIETAAQLAPTVKVAAVSSNHGRVRKGKAYVGTPSDDYGIEVLSQVADIAAANPAKYGHVTFYSPGRHDEALALRLVGGKVVGLVHGHQTSSIDRIDDWWKGQSHGRTPVGQADYLVAGHWHNMRVSTSGDDRWIFSAPTADSGSSWFKNLRGHDSAPGVMAFTVDPDGWNGLALC